MISWRQSTLRRAAQIDQNPPLCRLLELPVPNKPVRTVIHWFRHGDLRIEDNRALWRASELAHNSNQKLVALYVATPTELHEHGVGVAKLDFMLRGLDEIRRQLADLNIPLVSLICANPHQRVQDIAEFSSRHGASHVFANIEYEFDELQRDIRAAQLLSALDIAFVPVHDQTMVEPGSVCARSGGPLKVFTPFHVEWIAMLKRSPELLDLVDKPHSNSDRNGIEDLFTDLPMTLDDLGYADRKNETSEEKPEEADADLFRLRILWPAGHAAAVDRLQLFLRDKIQRYDEERSIPSLNNSSRLSPYLSTGMISVREVLSITKAEANNGTPFSAAGSGVSAWVREIAFREHYRQLLAVVVPHVATNLPQNLKMSLAEYHSDPEGWKRWCDGSTGVPFVDAGMRQLKSEAWMHNRLRMNVASYLKMTLMIDYRYGAHWFAGHLIDWDLANNSFGWEPSYTVFNPILQAERLDPNGEYIRHWIPELRSVEGKAVFDPFNRLSREEFAKLGYPPPYVDNLQERKPEAVLMLKSATAEGNKRIKTERFPS